MINSPNARDGTAYLANIMLAEALAPTVAKASVAMVLTV